MGSTHSTGVGDVYQACKAQGKALGCFISFSERRRGSWKGGVSDRANLTSFFRVGFERTALSTDQLLILLGWGCFYSHFSACNDSDARC